jgi:hypothetical protein
MKTIYGGFGCDFSCHDLILSEEEPNKLCLILLSNGKNKIVNAKIVIDAESKVSVKMDKLPLDISIDCLKLDSAMSPKTKAKTKGAKGYCNFLNA